MANAEEILNTASVEDQQAASNSAKLYLYTLDAGKYEESWTLIAPEMQNTISKSIYTAGINRRARESKAMAHKLGPPWREAPDSWVGAQRRAMVALPSRRAVGAKKTPRDRRHWAQGLCQVFTEGRGTTFYLGQSWGISKHESLLV